MLRLFIVWTLAAGSLSAQSLLSTPGPSGPRISADAYPKLGKSSPCPPGIHWTAEARFREYVIRVYREPPEACVRILKGGALVYSRHSSSGSAFGIGNNFSSAGSNIPIGTDITGAGKPNAIVSEWTGGVHCCFTLHVFELGEPFHEIAQIEADDSDTAHFIDLDHDGYYEFEGYDFAFAYWKTAFAFSPAPRIVLKYRGGRLRLALDLMKQPAPSTEEFAARLRAIKSDREWGPEAPPSCDHDCGVPVALWRNMLVFMYGGHSDLA